MNTPCSSKQIILLIIAFAMRVRDESLHSLRRKPELTLRLSCSGEMT